MNHSTAKKQMIKGHEITRELTDYCFNINRKRTITAIINDLNLIKRSLFESGEIKQLNHLYRYGLSVLDPEGMKSTEKKQPKLTKKDAVILFNNISVYPAQIIKFLCDDQVFNNLIINSALKSGTLNDIDHRDAKPWGDVALRLARIGDSYNWSYLLKEATSNIHGDQIQDIMATLSSLSDIEPNVRDEIKNSVSNYLEYCEKNKKYATESTKTEITLDGIFHHTGEALAIRYLNLSRLHALPNKDFMFNVYDNYGITLDSNILKRGLSSALLPGGLAGSGYSLLWVAAKHSPDILMQSIIEMDRPKTGNKLIIAGVIKQLNRPIEINGTTYKVSHNLMNKLIGHFLNMSEGDNLKDITAFLEERCELDQKQYIGLKEFAPFRRHMVSMDMDL